MKEYSVHFSYYSEEYGNFDDKAVKVEAENQFDARRMAWDKIEKDDDMKFASCVKLCGITWKASPLDMQDYFNAQASLEKYRTQYIERVDIPNAKIAGLPDKILECEQERYSQFGSLYTISCIAGDFGRAHGIIPPAIYEELHYAKEFLNLINSYDYEKYNALYKQIERAEKWDNSAMHSITELCKNGYGMADGQNFDFSAQFGKDGVYPVHADRTDFASTYISRWTNASEYKSLTSLPFFGEKDIVANSNTLQYDWQTLVIRKEALPHENQTPVNALWIANQGSEDNFEKDGNGKITAENIITGEVAEFKRSDFLGILRPEKSAKIYNETIKSEYKSRNADKSRVAENTEKPSILKTVEDNKNRIAQEGKTDKPNKSHISIDD